MTAAEQETAAVIFLFVLKMLSGNEHSHNERLTADDADGKAGILAGGGMKASERTRKRRWPMRSLATEPNAAFSFRTPSSSISAERKE